MVADKTTLRHEGKNQRRLTTRGRQRRDQIIEFATRKFYEKGFHPTSISEIVGGIGAGKGVFYWYFDSKEELFGEILRKAHRDLRRKQRDAVSEEPDPIRRIEIGIRTAFLWLDANRHMFNLTQFAVTEPKFHPIIKAGEDIMAGDLSTQLTEAMSTGEIAPQDPFVLSHSILGVTNQLVRVLLVERGMGAEEAADDAISFCMMGLLGTRGTQ